jgi:hypothetical protein
MGEEPIDTDELNNEEVQEGQRRQLPSVETAKLGIAHFHLLENAITEIIDNVQNSSHHINYI